MEDKTLELEFYLVLLFCWEKRERVEMESHVAQVGSNSWV
jgi:hypothetical protein